jgi:hypothetical protein
MNSIYIVLDCTQFEKIVNIMIGLTHLDTKSIVINLQLSKIRILDMMFTALDFHIQSA